MMADPVQQNSRPLVGFLYEEIRLKTNGGGGGAIKANENKLFCGFSAITIEPVLSLFVCFPPWHHSDNKTFYGLNDASEKAEAETFLEAFETFLWRLQKDTITARC